MNSRLIYIGIVIGNCFLDKLCKITENSKRTNVEILGQIAVDFYKTFEYAYDIPDYDENQVEWVHILQNNSAANYEDLIRVWSHQRIVEVMKIEYNALRD